MAGEGRRERSYDKTGSGEWGVLFITALEENNSLIYISFHPFNSQGSTLSDQKLSHSAVLIEVLPPLHHHMENQAQGGNLPLNCSMDCTLLCL